MRFSLRTGIWLAIAAIAVAAGGASAVPEVEPNDAETNATLVGVGAAGNGTLLVSDTDYWLLEPSATGWIRLNYSSPAGIAITIFFPDGAVSNRNTPTPYSIVFNVTAGTSLYAIADATSTTGAYNFTTAFATTPSGFSKGPDETEPNDAPASATLLSLEGEFDGVVDDGVDTHDYWKIEAKAGDYITVSVDKLYGAPGSVDVVDVNSSLSWSFGYASIFAGSNRTLSFAVVAGGWAVPYTVSFVRQSTSVLADGEITLYELAQDDRFELFIHPANEPPAAAVAVDLATGSGYMFGETLCAVTGLDADINTVSVESAWIFDPVTTTNQKLVSSRTMTINIPGDGEGCFNAMSYDENGDLGSLFSEYRFGAKLTGDAAKVMASVDANRTDGAGGQLALWAVTDGTTETRARQWDASQATIDQAKAILNGAGVRTSLTPNPPAAGTPPGGTGGTSPSSAVPIIIGILVVLVVIAVVAGVASRAKQKRVLANVPPAGNPGAAPYTASSTGYTNPYGTQQGYAPASPYGYSPAPSYGYAPAPSQPPAYGYATAAAPAPPPAYNYGAPAASAPAPPPRAPPAAPPPAAPAAPPPAKPKIVETAPAAGTMPCPQCTLPVAFYAPACPACGLELNWN